MTPAEKSPIEGTPAAVRGDRVVNEVYLGKVVA